MGEVWRARDKKLGRDVAIKTLPKEFAQDRDRIARLEREAKLLAILNHPNIAAIYGLEESAGTTFIVLELVEGKTLADRLKKGSLSVEESIGVALQIAEALENSHEKGVIHRDLKPANIKITPEGVVKVLDFGLAKTHRRDVGDLSSAPTQLSESSEGAITGTIAYMSPEQAKGKEVDRTTDVWAFGCVLYEMLTGRPVFQGNTIGELLERVFKDEPDWSRLPQNTPTPIRKVLRRCLQKDRKSRLHDMADARLEIEEVGAVPVEVHEPLNSQAGRKQPFASVGFFVAGAVLAGLSIWTLLRPVPARVVRTTVTPSLSSLLSIDGSDRDIAITPDGTRIVYGGSNGTQLFLRFLDQLEANVLVSAGQRTRALRIPGRQMDRLCRRNQHTEESCDHRRTAS